MLTATTLAVLFLGTYLFKALGFARVSTEDATEKCTESSPD